MRLALVTQHCWQMTGHILDKIRHIAKRRFSECSATVLCLQEAAPGMCGSAVLADDRAVSASASTVFSRRQLMRGSCTKASSMAMTLSLFMRSTRTTFSQVDLQKEGHSFKGLVLANVLKSGLRKSQKELVEAYLRYAVRAETHSE